MYEADALRRLRGRPRCVSYSRDVRRNQHRSAPGDPAGPADEWIQHCSDDDHSEPEPEKEFVPPQFAWDDEPATAYDAKPPEVDLEKLVSKKVFEVKESEMKLISKDERPVEPNTTWSADVWTNFFGDQNTVSHFGIAVLWLLVDSVYIGFLKSLAN